MRIMWLVEWVSELPTWLRLGIPLLFLGLSTALWIGGVFWPWGWVVGVVLFVLSGKTDSEKKGYRF